MVKLRFLPSFTERIIIDNRLEHNDIIKGMPMQHNKIV